MTNDSTKEKIEKDLRLHHETMLHLIDAGAKNTDMLLLAGWIGGGVTSGFLSWLEHAADPNAWAAGHPGERPPIPGVDWVIAAGHTVESMNPMLAFVKGITGATAPSGDSKSPFDFAYNMVQFGATSISAGCFTLLCLRAVFGGEGASGGILSKVI